jgi:hypothetical protein
VSVVIPVSCPRMWPALAVGANPNTARHGATLPVKIVDGAGQHRRLPRSAGPTITTRRSWPATAAAGVTLPGAARHALALAGCSPW